MTAIAFLTLRESTALHVSIAAPADNFPEKKESLVKYIESCSVLSDKSISCAFDNSVILD